MINYHPFTMIYNPPFFQNPENGYRLPNQLMYNAYRYLYRIVLYARGAYLSNCRKPKNVLRAIEICAKRFESSLFGGGTKQEIIRF